MFAAFAAYYRARRSSSKAPAQPKNDTAAVPPTAQKKKKASESYDDENPSAKRRRSSRSAATRKVNYYEESASKDEEIDRKVKFNKKSSSDDQDIDELLEQYRPTKSIKSTTNKVKNNPRSIVSFTPLTGMNAADESSLPGPGWTLGHWKGSNPKRSTVWISPQRKIVFRMSAKARQFESIRQKYDGDEYKSWEEFRNRNQLSEYTSVFEPKQYDSPDRGHPYRSHDTLRDLGWEKVTYVQTCGGKKYHWLSPKSKIRFKFAKGAMVFQKFCEKWNSDEEKAWREYLTKFSSKQIQSAVDGGLHGFEKAKEQFGTKRV